MAVYVPQTWEDTPSTNTPISAARLTYMEDGIAAAAGDTENIVSGSDNGAPTPLTLWIGTAADYAAIAVPDPQTVYCVTA